MQDSPGDEPVNGEELRRATFPQARRGYDREAVHAFLDRVADWVEDAAGTVSDSAPGMKAELQKVGERTAGILTAADEAAGKLRTEAKEYAQAIRQATDEESRRAKLAAGGKAEELIAEAEARAERIIDDAIARRRRLNQAISSLVERRDDIAEETARLADDLLAAVDDLRSKDAGADEDDDADADEDEDPESSERPVPPQDPAPDEPTQPPPGPPTLRSRRFESDTDAGDGGQAQGQPPDDQRRTKVQPQVD